MARKPGAVVGRRGVLWGALAALAVVSGGRRGWASEPSLEALGRRFLALRKRRQAKQAGVSDPVVDGWGGELHQVMTELGKRLGTAGTSAARVRAIMGAPDEQKPARWVYAWRGGHDYLYFELARGAVVRSGWYMAGE